MEFKPSKKLNDDDLEEFRLRYSAAFSMNQRYIDRLIEAVQLTSPLSDGLDVLYGFNDTGVRVDRNIFDSTAQYASSVRANNLHSLIWPVGKHWGGVYKVNKKDNKEVFDEEVTNTAFNFIEDSNLHSVAKTYFQDINIGCAALWIDSPSKDKPIVFKNLAGMTLMPEYSDDPDNTNLWFKKVISWYDLKKINPSVASLRESKKADGTMLQFSVTCGYLDLMETHGGYLLIQFLDEDFSEPLCESWSPFSQIVIANDNVKAGEARGQGVSMVNLEKIRYLNDITEKLKSYVEYQAEPALLVDDRLPSRIHDLQGARIPSDLLREEGRMPIEPLQWKLEIQAVEQMLQNERNQLMQIYNINPLGMPEESPKATATEVGIRNAMSERQTTADLSRISRASLSVLKTVVNILIHRGILSLESMKDVKLKFDSPEVDIQSSEDINTLLQYASVMGNTFGPQAFALSNDQQKFDSYVRNKLKVSSDFQSSAEEVKAKNMAVLQQAAGGGDQQQQPVGESQFSPATPISPTQVGDTSVGGLGL